MAALFRSAPLFAALIIGVTICATYLVLRKASAGFAENKISEPAQGNAPLTKSLTFKKNSTTPTAESRSHVVALGAKLNNHSGFKISLIAEYSSQEQYATDFPNARAPESLYHRRALNIFEELVQNQIIANRINIEFGYAMIAADSARFDEIEGPVEPGVRIQVA